MGTLTPQVILSRPVGRYLDNFASIVQHTGSMAVDGV